VRRAVAADKQSLWVGRGEAAVRIPRAKVFVASVGKASAAMASAVAAMAPEIPGVIIQPPGGSSLETGQIVQCEGNHPIPGPGSFASTEVLLDAVDRTPEDTEILFLLSGGASALFARPQEGITRKQKAAFTDKMLRAGAPIGLLNRARLRLSALKGGRFLARVAPRRVSSLVLSDVPGGADWEIGSGPTCLPPDQIWREDLSPRLHELLGVTSLPEPLATVMGPGAQSESAIPGDRPHGRWCLVGDNALARRAAAGAARVAGHAVRISRYRLCGEASVAAEEVLRRLEAQPESVSCVVFGGETTVSLGPNAGTGGRSQELALAAVPGLAGRDWVLLAAGTDGVDGVGGATGAMVGPGTLSFLGAAEVRSGLRDHDSASVLARAGALMVTGPTGTNVGDLVIALRSL